MTDPTRPFTPTLPDDELYRWLREDAPFGDLSTQSLPLGACHGQMSFHARAALCVAGIEEAARLIELAGGRLRGRLSSGMHAAAGEPPLHADGPAPALLLAWKQAQTTVEVASGIATATAAIVGQLRAAGFRQPVACTRKNFPGTRALAAKAVLAGGGLMHRVGLSESLLVFPEHLAFIAPEQRSRALQALHAAQPEKRLLVEVCTMEEALDYARAGVDGLQLERFTPAQLQSLRACLQAEGLRPMLMPAGGVTMGNAVDYARAGADLLVTSAPYMAPRADVKVVLGPICYT
jgi:molybdenum transport protein